MKFYKYIFPIMFFLLLFLVAGIVLTIDSIINNNFVFIIVGSITGGLSLIGEVIFGIMLFLYSKQAVGNVSKTMMKFWAIFTLVIFILVIAYLLVGQIYMPIDMTHDKNYSISKPTKDLINKIDNKLIIEYYYNDKCKEQSRQAKIVRFVIDILKEYERFSHGMIEFVPFELSYKNDMHQIEQLLKSGLQEFPLTDSREDESTVLTGISGIIIKYQDQKQILPIINIDAGLEYRVDVEIQKLIEKTNLGIVFKEPNLNFQEQFYVVDRVTASEYNEVKQVESGRRIPDDISALLIIGGEGLTDYDLFQIDQYLMKGGKALILTNGVNVADNPQYGIFGFPSDNKLHDMLAYYGFKINKNIIGDNDSFLPRLVQKGFMVREQRYPLWPRITEDNFNKKNDIVNDVQYLNFYWPSSIDLDDNLKGKAVSLFHTTENSFEIKDQFVLKPEAYVYPLQDGTGSFDLGYLYEGELKSYFADKEIPVNENGNAQFTGSKLDSGKTTILVVGNNKFLETQYFQQQYSQEAELLFFMDSLDYISKERTLIEIRDKGQVKRELNIKSKGAYKVKRRLIIIISTAFIPVLFILIGILMFILRYFYKQHLRKKY